MTTMRGSLRRMDFTLRRLARVIERTEEVFMAQIDDLRNAIQGAQDAWSATQQEVLDDVQALKDQIAALEAAAVSQADIDALTTSVDELHTKITGLDPVPDAPVEEPPA